MIQIFNAQSQNKAILVKSNHSGYIVAQGFAPFWIGTSRQALENLLTTPPGGFNQEVRDGIYIDPAKIPGGIWWQAWAGDILILNGTAVGDNINNVVTVQPLGC
jgi:hypothetical protein